MNSHNHNHNQQNYSFSTSIADTKFSFSSIISWFQTYLNNYIHDPVHCQELYVWQKYDRLGSLQWYAYDSATGRSIEYATENEVRVWLESILYQ